MCENLDCMTTRDLWSFWTRHRDGANAIFLFHEPANVMLSERIKVTSHCAAYALNKANAQEARAVGMIEEAQRREKLCDTIYELLPEWAKW